MSNDTNNKIVSLFQSNEAAEEFMISQFGKSESYDINMKYVHVHNMDVFMININGLTDTENFTRILTATQPTSVFAKNQAQVKKEDAPELDANKKDEKVDSSKEEKLSVEAKYFFECFPYFAWEMQTSKDKLLAAILSGQVAFITPSGIAFVADLRSYPGRQPEEPDNEKVIRGSRDGFTENIVLNTALIRRRIRDTSLRFELHQETARSKMDIAIVYIKELVNDEHLHYVRERIKAIHHDGMTMSDKSLEEWLIKQRYHPLPFVRYSERPDIVAAHVLEGHIAIVVDTSPSVILVPITMFHHLQHAEEYRQAPAIGTMLRFLRFFGVFLSFFLLPLWFLLVKHPEFIPQSIDFIGINKKTSVPLLVQILTADIGVEFLRIAAIHTPTPLSTAMGLISGIIIGQIAIDVGLFSAEVVLYTAISAIFTFAIPSYELSISIKIFRTILLLLTAALGLNGFFIGLFLLVWYMVSLKPMKVPYLWPLIPFFPVGFAHVLIRFPMTNDAPRPYIVGAKDRKRN
ncbi:spore germination protein [Rummeliibacillus sp. G93]|uniref:spore germination protein n=1 Tax=Rummeliibacillus sp. G93 TaxID=2939494 RepID=UPI00201C5374|nr:spore germination protein [Rummeliibacillus sp. G93]UQW98491.1 spore germination protein [Rummeliibacillus sp. G93]